MQAIILLSFLPLICLYFREKNSKDTVFWLLTCIAVFISVFHAYINHHTGWDQSFSSSLWLTITSCLLIFAIVCLITDHSHRLSFLLFPYLFIIGVFAIIWTDVKYPILVINFNQTWLAIHIFVSLATYALVTLAAFAALASMLQERCIKTKKRNHLSFKLPSIASSEQLFVRLLVVSEIVLFIGLMTGISINYLSIGYLFSFEHKPVKFIVG